MRRPGEIHDRPCKPLNFGDAQCQSSGKEPYDDNNIFARILRGEIPWQRKSTKTISCLPFNDIHPQAPSSRSGDSQRVNMSASPILPLPPRRQKVAVFFRTTAMIAKQLGVEETGYRTICNTGPNSHQEVPHFHICTSWAAALWV